jgi:hypothetical protein
MAFWFVDTAGIGSIIVLAVGLSVLAAYLYVLRWIQTAPPDPAPVPTGADQPDKEAVTVPAVGGEEA